MKYEAPRLGHLSIVYTLAYPDGYFSDGEDLSEVVFYVGQGERDRARTHEAEALTACKCEKCKAIRAIWDAGKMVQTSIYAENLTPAESKAMERECILIRFSSPYLVNKQHNRHRTYKKQKTASSLRSIAVSSDIYDRLQRLIEKTGATPDRILSVGINNYSRQSRGSRGQG